MTCSSCRFWDRYADSDISEALGDCRFNPPRISEAVLVRMLPGMNVSMSDHCDFERDIYVASAFPVTHETSECGRWEGSIAA